MKLCRSTVVIFPQCRNVPTRREQRLQSPGEKNVINEGAHIMHLFLSTYLPLFVLGST